MDACLSVSAALGLSATSTSAKVLKVAEAQPAGYPTVMALQHMGDKLK